MYAFHSEPDDPCFQGLGVGLVWFLFFFQVPCSFLFFRNPRRKLALGFFFLVFFISCCGRFCEMQTDDARVDVGVEADEDWAFLREPKAPAQGEYTGPPRCALLAEIFKAVAMRTSLSSLSHGRACIPEPGFLCVCRRCAVAGNGAPNAVENNPLTPIIPRTSPSPECDK
jgi:hypothetical protein